MSKMSDEFERWYATAADNELLDLQKSSAFLEFRSGIYKKMVKAKYLEKYDPARPDGEEGLI